MHAKIDQPCSDSEPGILEAFLAGIKGEALGRISSPEHRAHSKKGLSAAPLPERGSKNYKSIDLENRRSTEYGPIEDSTVSGVDEMARSHGFQPEASPK